MTETIQRAFEQVIEKLNYWIISTIKMLPNMVVALIVLALFWFIATMAGRLAHRMTMRITPYGHVARLVGEFSRMMFIAIGIILALSAMSLDRAVASMLAGVGLVGIAVGLAAKDIAGDIIAGLVIHFSHPFRTGHLIKLGEFFGYVESIEMRVTKCMTQQGQRVIIPNRKITEGEVYNFTVSGNRRVDLKGSVSYVVDLQQLEDLIIQAVEPLEARQAQKPVEFYYESFDGTTVNFEVRFWTQPEQKTYLVARSEAIKAVDLVLKKQQIILPSQNVSVDFGVTGGPGLREQLDGMNLHILMPQQQNPGQE